MDIFLHIGFYATRRCVFRVSVPECVLLFGRENVPRSPVVCPRTFVRPPRPTTCNRPPWLDWSASRPSVRDVPCARNDFLPSPPPVTDGRVARGTSARLCVRVRVRVRAHVRLWVVVVQWPKIGSRYIGGWRTVH